MYEELIKQICSSNAQALGWRAEVRRLLKSLWNLIYVAHSYHSVQRTQIIHLCVLLSVYPDIWILIKLIVRWICQKECHTALLLFYLLIDFIFQLFSHFHVCVTCECNITYEMLLNRNFLNGTFLFHAVTLCASFDIFLLNLASIFLIDIFILVSGIKFLKTFCQY